MYSRHSYIDRKILRCSHLNDIETSNVLEGFLVKKQTSHEFSRLLDQVLNKNSREIYPGILPIDDEEDLSMNDYFVCMHRCTIPVETVKQLNLMVMILYSVVGAWKDYGSSEGWITGQLCAGTAFGGSGEAGFVIYGNKLTSDESMSIKETKSTVKLAFYYAQKQFKKKD